MCQAIQETSFAQLRAFLTSLCDRKVVCNRMKDHMSMKGVDRGRSDGSDLHVRRRDDVEIIIRDHSPNDDQPRHDQ